MPVSVLRPSGPKNNFTALVGPEVGDDETQGYSVGSRWIVEGGGEVVCLDASAGAAVWAVAAEANPDEVIQPDGSVPMEAALPFEEQGSDPAQEADQALVYAKDVAGASALFVRTDDGVVHQLSGRIPVAAKPATETRTGTDAPTMDTDLILTLQPGTYRFELHALVQSDGAPDTGGLAFGLGGTATTTTRAYSMAFIDSDASTREDRASADIPNFINVGSLSAELCSLRARGLATVTVAGTFGLQWAQFAATADNLSMLIGSYLSVAKI